MTKSASLLLALLLLAGTAGAQTPVQSFAAGETLDYNLTWLAVSGGTMTMTIGPSGADRYRITSIASSSSSIARLFKFRDEIETYVARDDFSTLDYHKHLDERGKVKEDRTTIDETRKVATRVRPNKPNTTIAVTPPIFDPLSLVYHLRTLDLTPGKVHRFTVIADGKVYTLVATVTGRETVKTESGTYKTVNVEPRMLAGGLFRDEDSKMTISYTDDARHLPVRIRTEVKVGTIIATLKGVR